MYSNLFNIFPSLNFPFKGLMLSRSLNNGYKPYDFMQKNLLTVDLNNNIGFHIDMNKSSSHDSHA